jgi:hypothetical protein
MLYISNFNHIIAGNYNACSFYTSETTSAVMCQVNSTIVISFRHVNYKTDNKNTDSFIFWQMDILVSLENTCLNISLFSTTYVKFISPTTDVLITSLCRYRTEGEN